MARPEIVTHSKNYAPRCPACGSPVSLQATVEAFGEPRDWHFYGQQGERWIKCRAETGGHMFVHFVTLVGDGQLSHRIAWFKATPPAPPQQMEL